MTKRDDGPSRFSNPPRITNTSQQSPLLHLLGAMDDQQRRRPQGSFIEDMEARGQAELAGQTEQLPTDGSEDPAWAKMGVVFGERIQGDIIWRKVKLPEGWKVVPTDHAMWSHLVDAKGRRRGGIFYKAAFYDRSCRIGPDRRFNTKREYEESKDDSAPRRQRVSVTDAVTGEVVLTNPWVEFTDGSTDEARERNYHLYKALDAQETTCKAWLAVHWPDWQDASAYWD